jgi:hypothetical protein
MALALTQVKPILAHLVEKGALTAERQQWVVDGIRLGGIAGQNSGQFVVDKGWVAPEALQEGLKDQAILKGNAAAQDIKAIIAGGKQDIPATLRVNIGNGSVAPASANPTLVDGASAAANIAQNLVVMVNSAPQLAPELKTAVDSASALAIYLAVNPTEKVPLNVLQQWQRDANEGLLKAALHFETTDALRNAVLHNDLKDGQRVPDLKQFDAYLVERNKELSAAMQLTSPWQSRFGNGASKSGGDLPSH